MDRPQRGRQVTVIEDEASISDPLRSALEREGYVVSLATTGAAGVESVRRAEPDIVLLDLGLPDVDGRDVCRAFARARRCPSSCSPPAASRPTASSASSSAPTTTWSSRSAWPSWSRGSAPSCAAPARESTPAAASTTAVEVGDVRIDAATHVATHAGEPLDLPRREFDLLHMLMTNAGTVLARGKLMDEVWGVDWFGSTKTLDVHVAGLRRRLGDDATEPRYIHTVRGVGFRFASPAELAG